MIFNLVGSAFQANGPASKTIFAFEKRRDLETRVWGHSRLMETTPFDRSYMTSY